MYKVKCRICGETFISIRPQYTTCSIQCRKEAAKERCRKWYRINHQHRMDKKWCQKDSDVLQLMLEQGKKAIEAADCMGWNPGTIWKHIKAEFPEYAVSARCREYKNTSRGQHLTMNFFVNCIRMD